MAFQGASDTNAQGSNFFDIGRDQIVNIKPSCQTIHNNAQTTALPQVQPNLSYKHMPSCSPLFTGRKNYLDRLEQYFGRQRLTNPSVENGFSSTDWEAPERVRFA